MRSTRPYTVTPAARKQRQEAALKHGLFSAVSAPRLRQRRLRRKVRSLRAQFPQLATAPDHLLQRYAEVDLVAAKAFAALVDAEVVNDDGGPRRLLSEYRLLLAELRGLADALGILAVPGGDPLSRLLAGGAK